MLLPIHKRAGILGTAGRVGSSLAGWWGVGKAEDALRESSGVAPDATKQEALTQSPVKTLAADTLSNTSWLSMVPSWLGGVSAGGAGVVGASTLSKAVPSMLSRFGSSSLGRAGLAGAGMAGANAIDSMIGGPGSANKRLIDMDPNSMDAQAWGARRLISGAAGGALGGIPIAGALLNTVPELAEVGMDTARNHIDARQSRNDRLEGNARLFPHLSETTLEGMNTDRMREGIRNRVVNDANAAALPKPPMLATPTQPGAPISKVAQSPWKAVLMGLGLGAGGYALSSAFSNDEEDEEKVRKVGFLQYVTEGLPTETPRKWVKKSYSYFSSTNAFKNPPQPDDLTVPTQTPPTHSMTGSLPGLITPNVPGPVSMPPDQSIKVPKPPAPPKAPSSNSKTVSTTSMFTSTL